MIDGFDMWCPTTDSGEKEFLTIKEILGIQDDNKVLDKTEEIFNLISTMKGCIMYMSFIGCCERYVLDEGKENSSRSFWLKCVDVKNRTSIHFIRKKKRSRKEEREVLKKIIYLEFKAYDLKKIKEKEEE